MPCLAFAYADAAVEQHDKCGLAPARLCQGRVDWPALPRTTGLDPAEPDGPTAERFLERRRIQQAARRLLAFASALDEVGPCLRHEFCANPECRVSALLTRLRRQPVELSW